MKKSQRILFSLAAAVMAVSGVASFSACGNKGYIPETVDIVAYDGSAVTVKFYHTMGANLQAVLDKHIPKFNALYPNIKIEHSTPGDYPAVRNQINTELTAGESPSIAYCYPDHVALYNTAKAVMTLDDYMSSTLETTRADGTKETMGFTEAQKNDYVPAFLAEGNQYGDNLMYTLPWIKSTEVMYYNKTYFDQKGYTVPTTWDEMEALCAKIKADDPTCIPLGYDSEANWFITMTEQMKTPYTSIDASNHFQFNTAENRAFVKKFREWYQKGYVITEETYGGYTSDLFTATTGQRCYMCIGSSAGAQYQTPDKVSTADGEAFPFEVDIAMIPQYNKAAPKVISQGPAVCLFKKTNPQECAAAWLFAKYFTTNVEFQAEFSMTSGYAPVIQSVNQNPVYAQFLADSQNPDIPQASTEFLQAVSVKQAVSQLTAYYVSPAFNGSSAARDEVGLMMQRCFTTAASDVDAMISKQFEDTVKKLSKKYDE
jgi:multiple sugar transport system substrate-binding protein